MTVVVFEQVYAPRCILFGIDSFFAIRTKRACASVVGSIGINAKLQTLAVSIVHRGFHADGELGWIFLWTTIGMTIFSVPKVINDEIVVPNSFQTLVHHGVRYFLHHVSRDFVLHHVPRNPSHHGFWQGEIFLDSESGFGQNLLFLSFRRHNVVVIVSFGFGRSAFYNTAFGIPSESIGELSDCNIERGIGSDDFVQHALSREGEDVGGASQRCLQHIGRNSLGARRVLLVIDEIGICPVEVVSPVALSSSVVHLENEIFGIAHIDIELDGCGVTIHRTAFHHLVFAVLSTKHHAVIDNTGFVARIIGIFHFGINATHSTEGGDCAIEFDNDARRGVHPYSTFIGGFSQTNGFSFDTFVGLWTLPTVFHLRQIETTQGNKLDAGIGGDGNFDNVAGGSMHHRSCIGLSAQSRRATKQT